MEGIWKLGLGVIVTIGVEEHHGLHEVFLIRLVFINGHGVVGLELVEIVLVSIASFGGGSQLGVVDEQGGRPV